MITVIRNAAAIVWRDGRHEALENATVAFKDSAIVYAGESYTGHADQIIDASRRLVIPGFVNTHVHITDTPFTKGLLEDQGEKDFSTLYNILPAVRHATGPEDQLAAAECGFAELLLSGSTTVVELSFDFEMMNGGDIGIATDIANIAGRLGLRCYMGPRYRNGFYGLGDDGKVFYRSYGDDGQRRFEDCVAFCRANEGRYDGRLRTLLAPGQVDTCDADLLRETRRVADELNIPVQLHAGQSPTEFRRVHDRHGMTTVEYMAHTGLLAPGFLIGHGMWLASDGDVDHLPQKEIELLRDSQATIAHLPWVKARQASVINSFHKYRNRGINVSLGTDTFPLDMFNEMRWGAVIGKIVEKTPRVATAKELFDAATIGGAKGLCRDDLGRLAPGCKADIVILNIDKPHATPMNDPFKFVALGASAGDVETVIVDGQTVVERGRLLTADLPTVLEKLREANKRVQSRVRLSV